MGHTWLYLPAVRYILLDSRQTTLTHVGHPNQCLAILSKRETYYAHLLRSKIPPASLMRCASALSLGVWSCQARRVTSRYNVFRSCKPACRATGAITFQCAVAHTGVASSHTTTSQTLTTVILEVLPPRQTTEKGTCQQL